MLEESVLRLTRQRGWGMYDLSYVPKARSDPADVTRRREAVLKAAIAVIVLPLEKEEA